MWLVGGIGLEENESEKVEEVRWCWWKEAEKRAWRREGE